MLDTWIGESIVRASWPDAMMPPAFLVVPYGTFRLQVM